MWLEDWKAGTMKFSVIVPARNEEKYIGACLEAVKAVTLAFFACCNLHASLWQNELIFCISNSNKE